MEITIDEAIYCMKSYLPNEEYTHCTECKYYGCKDNKTCASNEAHQKAMNIMRKYQRIQEQAELAEKENHVVDTARMIMIEEIINGEVDNGNDD